MLTTHPSIMLGSYVWDQDWLPVDEFRIRIAGLEAAMAEAGWAGMLVYGDAREHSALAWVSNFIPRMRWAMALIPRTGEPRLLASMSSRDIPAMQTMTWFPEVFSGWEWKHFDAWAGGLPAGSTLGTAGFDLITPTLHAQVERSLAGTCRLAAADDVLARVRKAQRPREVALIRRSAEVTAAAADALARAWRAGDAAEAALLEAERTARAMAAQDVRTLLSTDGGRTLRPFRGTFDERPDVIAAYIAVKLLGYWSELHVTLSRRARKVDGMVAAALAELSASLKPGMSGGEVHAQATRLLGGRPLHPALTGSVGSRIGLAIEDGEGFTKGAREAIAAGNVYALRLGTIDAEEGGALASAMLACGPGGGTATLLPR